MKQQINSYPILVKKKEETHRLEIIEKRDIKEIKEEVDKLVGAPMDKPKFTNEVVGVVKWVDGTIIDSIFKVKQ